MNRPIVKCGMPIIIGTALGRKPSITFFGGYDVFKINVNQSQIVSGVFQTLADTEIEVSWGDGSSNTYSGTDDQAYSHDYGSVGDYVIKLVEKSKNCLTKFSMVQSNTDISFDIGALPRGLISFYITGNNTISGDIGNAPAGLTYFRMYGQNTISGDLENAPAGLGTLSVTGNNTISNYTTKTWTTKITTFKIVPILPGGLDATEIDNLFIDLDADLDCSSLVITLTGTNAAPTPASQSARDNIVAEGGTIVTN